MQLSKSDYLQYLKHPAWLWLKKHQPDKIPPIDANTQARFDAGNEFEEYAEQLFPGATKLTWTPGKPGSYNQLLLDTKQEMEKGTEVLFQARFISGRLTFIADVIENVEENTYNIYEIKSTNELKKEHFPDLSFQQVVMEQLGYKVHKIYVIHLNREYVRQGEINVKELTYKTDVTEKVKALLPVTQERVHIALEVIDSETMPDPSPRYFNQSGQLDTKYKAEYMKIFRSLNSDIPEYSIYDIAGSNLDAITVMEDKNELRLEEIPDDLKISGERAKQQLIATKQNRLIIDKEKIHLFLKDLEFPLYFLDYESINVAIPPFDKTWPYQQIVFQYSVHIMREPGDELEHFMYLHEDNSHPADALTAHMQEHIGDEGSIIVWHKTFETQRNDELGRYKSEFKAFFDSLNDRTIDLKVPFAKNWYVTKEFRGSASIKDVLPVLVPELSYKELQVQDGVSAGRVWREAIMENKHDNVDEILEDLRKYNKLDTLAMVEIYKKLLEIK